MSYPGEKAMACIRSPHLALLFAAVQSDGIGANLRTPKLFFEAGAQFLSLRLQPSRYFGLAQQRCQFRRAIFGGVGVALHLAQRNGRFGEGSIRMKHRIVRIFPALLGQAVRRVARIFDKAVAILVAVMVNPVQGGLNVRP